LLFKVHGKDRREAAAFIVACLLQLKDEDRFEIECRMTIVEERDGWRGSFRNGRALLLVPLFDDREILGGAISRGHVVIVPTDWDDESDERSIILPPVPTGDVLSEIRAATEGAVDLAAIQSIESIGELRESLEALRSPGKPAWARAGSARKIVPFVLAGQWEDRRESDQQILEELAQEQYSDLTNTLIEWRMAPRPPVRKVGSAWVVEERGAAWEWLHDACAENDLSRFQTVSVRVLREIDPKYRLPPPERWMAPAMGHVTRYSSKLREGLADGLAMLGAMGLSVDGHLASQDWACVAVRDVLAGAGWELWASLSPLLGMLAEACPDEFLSALERSLAGGDTSLRALFTDQGDTFAASASPHVGLVHALECLGRSPEYFSRVVLVLARLSLLDPDGRLANRPRARLSDLFLVGLPQTAADADQRFAVLDTLRQRFPEVAWDVMLGALPHAGRLVTVPARPRWRLWRIPGES
jgi:hypothetical protein